MRGARVRPQLADLCSPPLLGGVRLRRDPGHLRSDPPDVPARLDGERGGGLLGAMRPCRRVRVRRGLLTVRRGSVRLRAHLDRAHGASELRASPAGVRRDRQPADLRLPGGSRLRWHPLLRGERRALLRDPVRSTREGAHVRPRQRPRWAASRSDSAKSRRGSTSRASGAGASLMRGLPTPGVGSRGLWHDGQGLVPRSLLQEPSSGALRALL
jgi:hypothetical protein